MIFDDSSCATDKKLANFSKYVRRQNLVRLLVQYELFQRQLRIKGSIVECGVHHGGGVMAWAKLSSILEPYNYHRKIIGFDTFEGFPSVSESDPSDVNVGWRGDLNFELIERSFKVNDLNRPIGHIP